MNYIIGALAVYKTVQVLDLLAPKEAMPWVKVILGTAISYAFAAGLQIDNLWIAGLTMATLAGACHGVLRLITLLGDYAQRKSVVR